MALRFTLSPEHCARFSDVLACLSKFSDIVSLEARYGQLVLSTLNSSKSTFAYFAFDKDEFFAYYEYDSITRQSDRFSCCILNKALASVFRGRLGDTKSGEGAIERCEVVFEDHDDGEDCRLVVKLIYRQGMTKTFKLTYEATDMMQAVFDRGRATNSWKAGGRMLKEFADHFGFKTEQLDMCADEGQLTMTSYTEKITNGKGKVLGGFDTAEDNAVHECSADPKIETLKQPLQTSVTIDTSDFDQFDVQDELHIAISVKDFRNVVTHAVTFPASISAMYSAPSQPLQLSYSKFGIRCEYTLMTLGDYRGTTPSITRAATTERTITGAASEPRRSVRPEAPPPIQSQNRQSAKLGNRATASSRASEGPQFHTDGDSLFVPMDDEDEDQRWNPPVEREDDDAMLGWDGSGANNSGFQATFTDSGTRAPDHEQQTAEDGEQGILPTQRASQFKGLFD